jgi:hypothetical protein
MAAAANVGADDADEQAYLREQVRALPTRRVRTCYIFMRVSRHVLNAVLLQLLNTISCR